MDTIENLVELDDFGLFKSYIKNFVIDNDDLFRLIWFSNSNPFDEISCPYPDNPWSIFEESAEHGCVIFKRKNNKVLSEEQVNILIDFQAIRSGNSMLLDDLYIIVRWVLKGNNIQELQNGVNRSHAIAKLFDKKLNSVKVSSIGKVVRESYKEMPLNEENVGYMTIYKSTVFSNDLLEEANS